MLVKRLRIASSVEHGSTAIEIDIARDTSTGLVQSVDV